MQGERCSQVGCAGTLAIPVGTIAYRTLSISVSRVCSMGRILPKRGVTGAAVAIIIHATWEGGVDGDGVNGE
jgi:hypothetical protein